MLLADDDTSIQTAISRLLSASCEVVGGVADVQALFESVVGLRPDVVLLDFSLPGGLSGIEVCRHLKTLAPEVHVVAFTAANDGDVKEHAFAAGVSAYVWKLEAATDLLTTIHRIVDRPGPAA